MTDIATNTAEWSAGFWNIVGRVFLYMIGMFTPLSAFQGCIIGIIIAIRGSLEGGKPSPKGQIWGAILTVICWILVPVTSAVFKCLATAQRDSFGLENYPEYLLLVSKGWVILSLDSASVVLGAFLIYWGSSFIERHIEITGPIESNSNDSGGRDVLLYVKNIITTRAALLFEIISSTILGWTAVNVIVYAIKYGFFERHGGAGDFFYCYLYTLVLIMTWGAWMLAICIGPMLLLASIGLLGCLLYMVYDVYQGKLRYGSTNFKELIVPATWFALSFYAGAALTVPSIFTSMCMGFERKLAEATEALYESGAINETLSWTMETNFTGNYNISREPYRPSPPLEHGIGPMDVEFHCLFLGGLHFLPWLGLTALFGLVYWMWRTWQKRKAHAEGKTYHLASLRA